MNLSGSKGQPERETEARNRQKEKGARESVCVREEEAVDRGRCGDRKTGLLSAPLRDSSALC